MPKTISVSFKQIITSLLIGFGLLFSTVAVFAPEPVYAVCTSGDAACEVCEGSGGTWVAGAAEPCQRAGQKPLFGADSTFTRIVNILLFVVGALSVIMLIIGGIRYVVSGGDQNAVTGAKNTILYAIVGVVVAFLAWGLVNFVLTNLAR